MAEGGRGGRSASGDASPTPSQAWFLSLPTAVPTDAGDHPAASRKPCDVTVRLLGPGGVIVTEASALLTPRASFARHGLSGGNALSCTVTLDAGAAPGARGVTVTNPDARTVTLAGGFVVGSNQPPQVSVSFPGPGELPSGIVAFSAQAFDDVSLQSVQLLIDGSPVGTDTGFPYQWTVDTTALTPGLHQATVVATDTPGLQTTSPAVRFYTCGAYPTAVVSGGGTVCPAPGATIQAVLTGTGPWSLTWSDGVVRTATTSPATRTVDPATDTTYTLTALSDSACAAGRFTRSAPVVVAKRPAPVVTAPAVAGAEGLRRRGRRGPSDHRRERVLPVIT